ncbi:MAG: hypothetical protein FJX75_25740, partial [Armatimonadetes bacterium]|nr:hypothetical protein [Armatimonadota bacterium]
MAGCAPDPSIEQASAADASVWWLGAAVLAVLIAPIARVFWLAGGLAGEWFDGGLAAVAVVLALLTRRGDWVTRWLMPGLLYVVGWQPLLCFVGLRAVRTPWAHTLLWAVEWVPRRLAASIARGDCEAAPVWPAARRRGALAGVLAVAAVTGAMGLHSAQGRDVRGIDGRWYLTAADTLLRTGQFRGRHPLANDGSDPIARAARTPGYPAFLAACRLLAGQGDVRLASALQAVATVGAAAAAFLVAEALAGSLAGVAAGLLVAAYPPLWRDAPLILTEPLAVLLYPLVAHLLVGACRGNRAGLWLLSGFVLGLATLVRPNTLFSPPVVAVCAAGLLWRGGHPPRALARPALVVVGFVVVMMPWWIRNQLALGAFVPGTTLSGVHLWAGNYLPHHGRYRDYAYIVCTRVLHECGDDEVRADRAMTAMARAQAWDNLRRPAALMGLLWGKIGYLVLTPTEGTGLTRLLHPLLLLGAAIGLASLWRSAGSALLAAFALSIVLVHLASYAGEGRYFLPLMPLVAVWAGVAVSRLFALPEHAQSSPERRYPARGGAAPTVQRLRVGIDATYLLHSQKSGVETCTLNLTRALLALPDRPELFLYAAGPERPADAEPLLAAADRARVSPIPRLWLRLRMPAAMAWDGVTVAHFPGTLLPAWLPCPAVTTFY